MLEELKRQVYEAIMLLPRYGLSEFTWGNVSGIDRAAGLVVIKPSCVPYEELTPDRMVVVNMDGTVVEGDGKPSSDTPTHLQLYRSFDNIGGVTHTHSCWATVWAQAGQCIPALGTTHADYFDGTIPCTRKMTKSEIETGYEKNVGIVIAETFEEIDPMRIPAVLVHSHGPYTWGRDAAHSVESSAVLENVAKMAYHTVNLRSIAAPAFLSMERELMRKHYNRKNGPNAYYGC